MDFSFNEEQEDLKGLVEKILAGELTPERLKEAEAGEDNFDRDLWKQLAEAGVLGIAVPEAQGGGGYGFLEAALTVPPAVGVRGQVLHDPRYAADPSYRLGGRVGEVGQGRRLSQGLPHEVPRRGWRVLARQPGSPSQQPTRPSRTCP